MSRKKNCSSKNFFEEGARLKRTLCFQYHRYHKYHKIHKALKINTFFVVFFLKWLKKGVFLWYFVGV